MWEKKKLCTILFISIFVMIPMQGSFFKRMYSSFERRAKQNFSKKKYRNTRQSYNRESWFRTFSFNGIRSLFSRFRTFIKNQFFKKSFVKLSQKKKVVAPTAFSFFYGITTMINEETGQIIIIFHDLHEGTRIIANAQQQGLIDFANTLKHKRKTVCFIVEDIRSLGVKELLEEQNLSGEDINRALDKLLLTDTGVNLESPLCLLGHICKKKGIPCENIEFRDLKTTDNYREQLLRNVDKILLEELDEFYKNGQCNMVLDTKLIDIRILQEIEKHKDKDVVIVCTGGTHAASITSYLENSGNWNQRYI